MEKDYKKENEKLKPCPFCKINNLSVSVSWVVCRNCMATGPLGDTRSHGCQLWNDRFDEKVDKTESWVNQDERSYAENNQQTVNVNELWDDNEF